MAAFLSKNFERENQKVIQIVPPTRVSRYGTNGLIIPLPKLSDAVHQLVEKGWRIDPLDTDQNQFENQHAVILNDSTELQPNPNLALIGSGPRGEFTLRGEDFDSAGLYLSLPEHVHLRTLHIRWHLSRIPPPTSKGRQADHRFLVMGLSLAMAGLSFLFILQRTRPIRLSHWLLAGLPGGSLGILVSSLLVGFLCPERHGWTCSLLEMNIQLCLVAGMLAGFAIAYLPSFSFRAAGSLPPTAHLLTFILSISLSMLFAGWTSANRPNTSAWSYQGTSSALLANRLPFSDAGAWYSGSIAVSRGQRILWAARRPVHALIRSGELIVTGRHYFGSLIVQVVFCALALTSLVCVVWVSLNPGSAIITGLVALVGVWGSLGSFLAECSGITCACLGVAFSIFGWGSDRFRYRLAGYLYLFLGWLIRPGPFGLLLLPIACEIAGKRLGRWVRIATVCGGLFVMLIFNKAAFKLVAAPMAVENANVAPTLYGLATGSTWGEAYNTFNAHNPARKDLPLDQYTALMYREAWQLFTSDVRPALRKCLRDLWSGFVMAILYLPIFTWRDMLQGPFPRHGLNPMILSWIIWIASLIAAARLTFRNRGLGVFVLLVPISLLVSLPLVWGDGGFRGMALALPLLAVSLSLSLSFMSRQGPPLLTNPSTRYRPILAWVSAGLVLSSILLGIGWFLIKSHRGPVFRTPFTLRLHSDPVVMISGDTTRIPPMGLPTFSPDQAVQSMRSTASGVANYGLDRFVRQLKPGTLFAIQANVEAPSDIIVLEGAELANSKSALRVNALVPTDNPHFLRAVDWVWLE